MSRKRADRCARGHSLVDAYETMKRDGAVNRQCRTCRAERARITKCRRGHDLTDESNVRWDGARRRCITCANTTKRARKTHCANGHEFRPETTSVSARGWRTCLLCRREEYARRGKPKPPRNPVVVLQAPPRDENALPICQGDERFTSDDREVLMQAAKACRSCPLIAECAERALIGRYSWGVFAGNILSGRMSRRQRLAFEEMRA